MKMKTDPEIEEIRAIRRRISDECGHDPKRMAEYYAELTARMNKEGRFRFITSQDNRSTEACLTHR